MKRLFFSLILLGFTFSAIAQEKADSLRLVSALERYQNYDFEKVISLLSKQDSLASAESRYLAKSYLQLGQLEDAKKIYESALEIGSTNPKLKNELAATYLKGGDLPRALKLYQSLMEEQPQNAFYKRKVASIYENQMELVKAISSYREALSLNQKDLASAESLVVLYLKIQQFDLADSLLSVYLEHYPNQSNLLKTQLKTLYKKRKYKEVSEVAERLFAKKDSALLSLKLAGISAFHQKKFETAISFMSKVIQVDKKSEILHYYLGLSYCEIGETEKATEFLEKAIDLGVSKNLGNYYLQLAVSYEEEENYPEAIKAYQVAYKSIKDKVILYHLARSYDRYYKDKSIALSYYQKYLEEEDTANQFLQNYSKHRIEELKVARHFGLDSLN